MQSIQLNMARVRAMAAKQQQHQEQMARLHAVSTSCTALLKAGAVQRKAIKEMS